MKIQPKPHTAFFSLASFPRRHDGNIGFGRSPGFSFLPGLSSSGFFLTSYSCGSASDFNGIPFSSAVIADTISEC